MGDDAPASGWVCAQERSKPESLGRDLFNWQLQGKKLKQFPRLRNRAFFSAFPLFRDCLSRQDLEKDRNGASQTMQGWAGGSKWTGCSRKTAVLLREIFYLAQECETHLPTTWWELPPPFQSRAPTIFTVKARESRVGQCQSQDGPDLSTRQVWLHRMAAYVLKT